MGAAIYADREVRESRSRSVPVGSLGTAEDVAEAVAFLVSDKARYTTGHQLMVDGGISFSLKNHLPRKPPPVRM
jgi:NAD(P)-dependent dehydrogenase (short-subunit alcohol dehydrogenase family)